MSSWRQPFGASYSWLSVPVTTSIYASVLVTSQTSPFFTVFVFNYQVPGIIIIIVINSCMRVKKRTERSVIVGAN